jgi:hypothetical protein
LADLVVWAVYGPDPDDGQEKVLEVFTNEKDAETFLGGGLLQSAVNGVSELKPGGTFSLMLRRGTEANPMTGGYVVSNPHGGRAAKDYRLERLKAERVASDV